MTYPHILTYPYISNVVKFPDVHLLILGNDEEYSRKEQLLTPALHRCKQLPRDQYIQGLQDTFKLKINNRELEMLK